MNIALLLSVFSFFAQNKDTIKQVVTSVETLIPEAPGNQKAQAVKTFIGAAMGIEGEIEQAWPLVAPIFNLFVAHTKHPVAAVPAPQ
jgi:hypothetical protein